MSHDHCAHGQRLDVRPPCPECRVVSAQIFERWKLDDNRATRREVTIRVLAVAAVAGLFALAVMGVLA